MHCSGILFCALFLFTSAFGVYLTVVARAAHVCVYCHEVHHQIIMVLTSYDGIFLFQASATLFSYTTCSHLVFCVFSLEVSWMYELPLTVFFYVRAFLLSFVCASPFINSTRYYVRYFFVLFYSNARIYSRSYFSIHFEYCVVPLCATIFDFRLAYWLT